MTPFPPPPYGEDKLVVLLGRPYIEIVIAVMVHWLDGSEWTSVMAAANVTTDGRADSVVKCSQVSRGQWARQVKAAALHILQQRAFPLYQESILHQSEESIDFPS